MQRYNAGLIMGADMADVVIVPNTGLLATAGEAKLELAAGTIDLLKNNFDATSAYVFDAANVADYTGYAQEAVATWGETYTDPAGGYSFQHYAEFSPSGVLVTNTIYGYVVRDSNGVVRQVCKFENPVPMINTLSLCAIIARFNFQ